MGKKGFRADVRPAPARRQGLLPRLVLAGLVAQALGACGASSISAAVAEHAHTAARWGGCIVDNPPRLKDLAHPSAMVDAWGECAEPPRMMLGAVAIPATPPPRHTLRNFGK